MIVEYLRYIVDADRQEKFIADYAAAVGPLMSSPHARSFELCQCVEEPEAFILRIEWTSAEDHLQKFRGSAEFKEFFGHIRPYLNDIAEMRHYTRHIQRSPQRLACGHAKVLNKNSMLSTFSRVDTQGSSRTEEVPGQARDRGHSAAMSEVFALSARTAENLNSGIFPNGSSAALVRMLAAAST